ncbi:MAG: ABC transporter permease [Nitrososphaeria archaeon]
MNGLLYAVIMGLVFGTVPRAMPIFLASMGETVDQASGVFNLGVEGIMLMGAITGFVVDFYTRNVLLSFLAAIAVGVGMSFIHAYVSISMAGDQTISGTALWFIGWGLSGVIYARLFGLATTPPSISLIPHVYVPNLTRIPIVGKLIFGEDPLFYVGLLVLVVFQYLLFHTQFGLNLRAVGEDPRVAEIMGIDSYRYRYIAVLTGGALAGLGGAYLTLALVGSFYFNMTAGMGFIAVALVYFGKWNPWRVSVGSFVFGVIYALYVTLESVFPSVPYQFFAIWPYLATMIAIFIVGARAHMPSSLAMPYIKE